MGAGLKCSSHGRTPVFLRACTPDVPENRLQLLSTVHRTYLLVDKWIDHRFAVAALYKQGKCL